WSQGFSPGVLKLFVSAWAVWGILLVERLTIDRLVGLFSPPERHAARTIFVGPADMCREAAAYPALDVESEFARLGFLDLRRPAAPDALGSVDDLARTLHDLRVETVVVCGFIPDHELQGVVNTALAAGCHLLTVPRAIEVAGVHPSVIWSHGVPLMELTAPALRSQQRALKRMIDLLGAGLAALVTSPLMLAIPVAINVASRGPVFFRQERAGVGGRRFKVWKVRTMTHNAPDTLHREYMAEML